MKLFTKIPHSPSRTVAAGVNLQFTRQISHIWLMFVRNPEVGCHYFLSGPRLPSQLQAITVCGRYWFILLGEQRQVCERLAQGRCVTAERPGFKPACTLSVTQGAMCVCADCCVHSNCRCGTYGDIQCISLGSRSCHFLSFYHPAVTWHVVLNQTRLSQDVGQK